MKSLADYIADAPKKRKEAAKKPAAKKAEAPAPKPVEVVKEVVKPIAPIVKVVEQPDYSPAVVKQMDSVEKLARQAITSMREAVNHNDAVMAEVINRLAKRPKEFLIQRDRQGNIVKMIPVYDDAR